MYSQHVRLEKYLKKHKSINVFQAIQELSILRLSERIRFLQANGLNIDKKWITVKNRFGEDCRVVKYCLVK